MQHPLAVLRESLNLSQKQLADIAGCSTSAIQLIELKKRKLSEALAARIAIRTGVGFQWLRSGDADRPIENAFAEAMTPEELAQIRRELCWPPGKMGELNVIKSDYQDICYRLAKLVVASAETGGQYVCLHRVETLLRELEQRFAVRSSSLARRVRPGRVDSTAAGRTAITFDLTTIWRSFKDALSGIQKMAFDTAEKQRKRARTRPAPKTS
jgi:transcriptional regulator with XRE-family HTH domain